jgi:hypothetical protein
LDALFFLIITQEDQTLGVRFFMISAQEDLLWLFCSSFLIFTRLILSLFCFS